MARKKLTPKVPTYKIKPLKIRKSTFKLPKLPKFKQGKFKLK